MQEPREIKPVTKFVPLRERLQQNIGVRNIASDKVDYCCNTCKYEFSRAKSFPLNGQCPNCGKQTLHKKAIIHHDWLPRWDLSSFLQFST